MKNYQKLLIVAILLSLNINTFAQMYSLTQSYTISCNSTTNSGTNSSAIGYQSIASGEGAFATGYKANAWGANSFSSGIESYAIGDASFASGFWATAQGIYSSAFGASSNATGNYTFAVGSNSQATNKYSMSFGDYVTSASEHAFTIGAGTQSSVLTNDVANSLLIGFGGNYPALFVSGKQGSCNGKVGIGTKYPAAELDVIGYAKFSSLVSGGVSHIVIADATGKLGIGNLQWTDGLNSSIYRTTGNVSIGTTNTTGALTVKNIATGIAIYGETTTGQALYGKATTTTGFAGYFDGRGYFTKDLQIDGTLIMNGSLKSKLINAALLGTDATGNLVAKNAQWTESQNNIYRTTGFVSIGTNVANTDLTVRGAINTKALKLSVAEFGEAGNNRRMLIVPRAVDNAYGQMMLAGDMGIVWTDGAGTTANSNFNASSGFVLAPWGDANKGIRIDKDGNVGIGTRTPTALLTVNGKIVAEEVKVVVNVLPDYVFAPNYALRPLAEVECFVRQNSHLPEVPSAAEVAKDGLALGEMNATLLKKVEELTLYLIEQNKQILEQKNLINEQNKRIEKLEKK